MERNKPVCKLVGEDGNIFNLIGIVRKTLSDEGLTEELLLFDIELDTLQQFGGTYDDVLNLFSEFVEVI